MSESSPERQWRRKWQWRRKSKECGWGRRREKPLCSCAERRWRAQGRRYQRTFSGTASSDDIVVASCRAYVSGLNKLIAYIKSQQARPPLTAPRPRSRIGHPCDSRQCSAAIARHS